MAQAQRDQQPVSRHYLSQAGLAAALGLVVRQAWPTLDLARIDATLPAFTRQVGALVNRFSLTSSTLAAREYRRQRLAAGIRSSFTVPQAPPPNAEKVDRSLSWATRQLRDGTLADLKPADLAAQLDSVKVTVEGVAEKLVLESGRTTMVDAVRADWQAKAWAREARPDCCYFCAMLSGRGAVYRSRNSAGAQANDRFTGDGEFKFHDHCRCQVVPVFNVYEPTAHARQWAADWQRLKDEGGPVSLLAWRQHFEGRAPTKDVPQ